MKIKFDVLCISETWLHDLINDNDVFIDNYVIIRKDRPKTMNKKRGGGVCVYILKSIPYTLRHDLISNSLEGIWFEMFFNHEQVLMSCIYRPPNADVSYFNNLLDVLEKVSQENKELIILGDLNYDYILDHNLCNNPINLIENLFLMTQLVLKPTRVTSNSSKCLDHILTTIPERHAVTNVAKISLSDHYLIYTCIHFSMTKHNNHKEVTFRDYQRFDRDVFLQDLERSFDTSNLDFEDDMYNIDEKWFKWKSTFTKVCDKHAPLKTMRMKQRYCPWISKELVQLIYKRDFLKRKSDIDPAIKKDYKCIRNRITKLRRDNKRDYTKDVIRDCKKR